MSVESAVADFTESVARNVVANVNLRNAILETKSALVTSVDGVVRDLADKLPADGGIFTNGVINGTSIGESDPASGAFTTIRTFSSGSGSFFADDPVAEDLKVRISRLDDRFFAGAATTYTGRRTGDLGGDWLSENGANYFIKNSQAAILGTQRAGLLVGAYTPTGQPSMVNAGLMAVTVNKGLNSFGRGIYAEMFHMSSGGGSCAAEFQGGNYTGVRPVTSPYGASGVSLLYLGVESGHNYVTGNNNTPLPPPTQPIAQFIDFSGGSINAPYQKALVGLLFRNGSLYRGVDGLSGAAIAIHFARQHEIRWAASASLPGAVIRSDVSAVAGQDTGLIFNNTSIKIAGTAERSIAVFKDDIAGDGAVNWLFFSNARANVFPIIAAQGASPDTGIEFRGMGRGGLRFTSHDGAGENLRITAPADAPVNYMTISGGASGQPVTLSAAASANGNANIDVRLLPFGPNARVRFGKYQAVPSGTTVTIGGMLEIRSDDGLLRQVAILA